MAIDHTTGLMNGIDVPSDVDACHVNQTVLNGQNSNNSPCLHYYNPCKGECFDDYSLIFNNVNERGFASVVMFGYFYPILCLVILLTTIVLIVILRAPNMQTPTNAVLLYMSLADLIVGLVPFPHYFMYIMMGNYKHHELMQPYWCWVKHILTTIIPPMAHAIAMWLTVVLAGHRFLYVQYPIWATQNITVSWVRKWCLAVVIVSVLLTLPIALQTFEMRVDKHWVIVNSTFIIKRAQCLAKYSPVVLAVSFNTYLTVYYTYRTLIMMFLPCILLFTFSVCLVNGIQKAQQRKQRLIQQKRDREARRQGESNVTSIMLLVVVVIFLVVNLPQCMILLLIVTSMNFHIRFLNPLAIWLTLQIGNLLIMATFPLNFAIYCSMSTQFRDAFKQLLLKIIPKRIASSLRLNDRLRTGPSSTAGNTNRGYLSPSLKTVSSPIVPKVSVPVKREQIENGIPIIMKTIDSDDDTNEPNENEMLMIDEVKRYDLPSYLNGILQQEATVV